ncbi:hypothetical protein [Neptunomonas antarctica]|uniref:Uncharacterized protein n=1 Tax=Neptunomonas antarctica TaxID=619304 RepID=A0A1N7JF95_9GAMM|nr:hypothetical protein [Neptunomonas antarctica]SIS48007.1 hypothetical protein SAMN05421760_1011067 [Neptunomonas antarctica]
MPFTAHKLAVVIFMLIALATQAYASAFAADRHSFGLASPFQEQSMAVHHVTLNDTECADSCCEDDPDCSPVHCSYFTGCAVFSFRPDTQVVARGCFTGNSLILSQCVGSLYRPPISL